jgi:hypothetical protein
MHPDLSDVHVSHVNSAAETFNSRDCGAGQPTPASTLSAYVVKNNNIGISLSCL